MPRHSISKSQTRMAADQGAAEAQAKAWLAAHPKGVVTTYSPCSGAGQLKSLSGHAGSNMRFSSGMGSQKWSLNLGFEPAISKASSLQQVQSSFKWLAVDRVPLTSLGPVPGWEVYPQVPVSSFEEGVTITGFSGSKISLKVQSRFFAIYGSRTDVDPPADAGMPQGTYFQLRHNIPMDLTLELPIIWD